MAFSFSLPVFNLDVYIWRHDSEPTTDPPDVVTIGNLAWGKRVNAIAASSDISTGGTFFEMTLLLPPLTDIRGGINEGGYDIVEVPAGSGRMYTVLWVDDLGKGFDNEHRGAILQQRTGWPVPIP